MRADIDMSTPDGVFAMLGTIWNPGVVALKVQQDLQVHSLEDLSLAAERAGYEVCYADLPERVSGFAAVIAGKPHIVVNRARSRHHQQYTVAHELGHHVLHVNPTQDANQLGFPAKGSEEFEAHVFAATFMMGVTKGAERDDVLKQNRESLAIPVLAVLTSLVVIAIPLVSYLWSRLFPTRSSDLANRE